MISMLAEAVCIRHTVMEAGVQGICMRYRE